MRAFFVMLHLQLAFLWMLPAKVVAKVARELCYFSAGCEENLAHSRAQDYVACRLGLPTAKEVDDEFTKLVPDESNFTTDHLDGVAACRWWKVWYPFAKRNLLKYKSLAFMQKVAQKAAELKMLPKKGAENAEEDAGSAASTPVHPEAGEQEQGKASGSNMMQVEKEEKSDAKDGNKKDKKKEKLEKKEKPDPKKEKKSGLKAPSVRNVS